MPSAAAGPSAVVVAPHPDDEIFGAGALLRWLVGHGHRVRIIGVTDGEAAWGPLDDRARQRLVDRRAAEREQALDRLGVAGDVEVIRLHLPDGAVTDHEPTLAAHLVDHGAPLLVSTWRDDGHPDHEATGRAAATAAHRLGARLLEYLVWAQHRHRVDGETVRTARLVPMTHRCRAAKIHAAMAFRSQLEASPDGRPVVPRSLIDRLAVDPEVVLS